MHVRVWTYDVPADRLQDFIDAYGADGPWARLFGRGRGYLGTELFRSTDGAARFVTLDRWVDEGAWRSFLERHQQAYDALDAELAGLGAVERPLLEGPAGDDSQAEQAPTV